MRGTSSCNTRAPYLSAENLAYWCCSLSSHTAPPYPHTRQPSPHTADMTLPVLHTFSPDTADVTFLILHPFSSHHAACSSAAHVTLLILYTPDHTASAFPHTADATLLVLHTFSTRTADVTFLILQIFCSHHTPSPPITDVALLILSHSPHTAQLSDRIL